MYQYQPLKNHLAAQPSPQVTMSFSQIERVLGRPLPPSARGVSKRQWWANTDTHSQAKAWLEAGRTAKLDIRNDAVTFVRQESRKEASEDHVLVPRARLTPAAIRLLEDIAEETSVELGEATATLLNQAALKRRRETLDWFARNTVPSSVSSADLVRADRDAH